MKAVKKAFEFNEQTKSWAERSTFHGLAQLITAERISVKIIWSMCWLVSASYCGKLLVNSVADYWNYDVNTVVEILRDTNADFPVVTLCTLHRCGLEPYKVDALLASALNRSQQSSGSINSTNLKSIFKLIGDEYLYTSNRHALKMNKTSIKDNLISCQFSSEFCYENDFEFFQLNEFQKCFKFNSGQNYMGNQSVIRKARRYGKSYGLQLELFIGLPDKCLSPFSQTFGVVVYVHNLSQIVTEETNGVLVAPGTETNIAVDRTSLVHKPKPYSNCLPNMDASSAPSKFASFAFQKNRFKMYSQEACLVMCQQDFYVKHFGCYNGFLPFFKDPSYNGVKPCETAVDDPTSDQVDPELFYQVDADDACLESCPQECEYVDYTTTVSSSQFPTITYSDVLVYNENISENFAADKSQKQFTSVKSSVLSVNVFSKSDLYMNVREKPSTEFEQFISNFGGAMGLFLGISLLSLVEIFELFYELVCGYFEKRHLKLKIGSQTPSAVMTTTAAAASMPGSTINLTATDHHQYDGFKGKV